MPELTSLPLKPRGLFAPALVIATVLLLAGPALAADTTSGYATSWTVNNNADWTPFPPSTNPLGAPNNFCTGTSTPTGSWAEFSFGNLGIPSADVVTGIQVRFKYKTASSNTAQLYLDGSAVGNTKSVGSHTGSFCSSTAWKSVGGSSDLWGTSLTTADFNNDDVSVRLTQDANTIDLDSVEIIVTHESRAYASGWSVNNNADWTPFPPNSAPLGAPNDVCTGASTPTGSWAEFTFPAFTIPTGNTILGVTVRFKIKTAGTNTAQLYDSGASIGSTRSIPAHSGSYCSSSSWVTSGGSMDLWGATLTPADFNNGDISVRLTQDWNTVDLDSVEMIVNH
ncbi:MAG: hypothetical protein MI919_21635 [Holophagales bacterium]|nr:hypothetical protein [Holophagales bacterium]